MYTNTLEGSGGSKAELTIGLLRLKATVPYLQFSVQITAVVTTITQTATSPPTPQCWCGQQEKEGWLVPLNSQTIEIRRKSVRRRKSNVP